ncbi:MAG: DUF4390 domain-containing protein [Nitrospinae bacterium]|nr:DUF4390 domain-containing protein [Nitrospinota bacterium]MZH03823.1 DUF4390 domain-containing protein [Nitrospinota bacterium]MZH15007.1 DUF4390 domain-containing protein [Nitrospinota bacterium]
MISKIKLLSAFLLIGVFIFTNTSPVFAASPNIVNVGVSTKGKYVVMNARLIDGFTEKILEAIESGVPMGFTFEIELRKENTAWVDSLVSSNTIRHKIQYDSLKKAYRFSEVGKKVRRKVITRKTSRFKKLMLTLKDIPIAPIFHLDPNEKYYVRVKADLETDRFWFPFNYIFFFVPFSDFETSWAQTSPLSIDPDLELSKQAAKSKARKGEVSRNVIRSFNQ